MKYLTFLVSLPFLFWSCVGDDVLEDFVQPELRITNGIDSLSIDSTHQFAFLYLNNVGASETVTPIWSSSNEAILTIDANGLATAHSYGPVDITATYSNGTNPATVITSLHTAENPVIIVEPVLQMRQGSIRTTSTYALSGGFTIEELESGGIIIKVDESYNATTALPDLFLYLSNNPNSIGNALVVADVVVFSGAHEYVLPDVGIDEYSHLLYYCRPFNVKVGDGEITE